MKKFLLLLALILGATCAYAQEDVVTETFGSWFKPTSKPSTYTVAENVSPQTDITYQSTYAYYYTQESTLMLCKGTSTNTRGTIWFSLSYPISKITVHTGKNSSVSGKITVSASTNSGESYNDISVNLAIDKKDADFEITIPTEYQAAGTFYKIAQTTNNNTQVASLSYTKVITGPRTLGDLTASYGSKTIASDDVVTFDQGTSISFHADNATSFVINETEILEAVDGTATWTPAVCENTAISVVAKREIEGEETQTSEALTFTLTVKKPDSITAQWVVTGAGNATNNNVVDLNLQLDDNSDNGQWHAYCGNSYSGTISGGAQLGSGAKPFNNGTISLIESDIPENAIIKEITFNGFTNATYTLAVTVNGVSAGNISVNKSTAKDHTLSNLNLVGNQIVFTATSATKYLCVKGISVKYTIPEEEVQLGEITASYNAGFSMDEDTESELYVMAGTKITFSSENAAMMEITSSDEGINLPESVNASSISCEIPEGVFALTVNAFSEDKKQSTGKTFTIMGEEVTPVKPSIANHNTDAKEVTFSTEAGALMIMIVQEPVANSPMRIEAQDWTFTPDPKSHTINYSNLVDEVMLVSVKSVTPKAESEPYVMRLSSDGDVSGIEGVEAGATNGKAVYYNLQGQLVDATRPGLYIRCQGGRAEKVLVR